MKLFDTIAAVSTPRGKGGVAVIRISGENAVAVGEAVFSRKLSEIEPNRAVYGKIYLPQPNGERRQIDDGIVTVFRAPASFTGEDTVEITCHGGTLITRAVLETLLLAGAVPATAGEFTRRAFENGKMDLSAAESVMQLIGADSIRDVIAFPKVANSSELMSGAPANVDKKQLDDLGISLSIPTEK